MVKRSRRGGIAAQSRKKLLELVSERFKLDARKIPRELHIFLESSATYPGIFGHPERINTSALRLSDRKTRDWLIRTIKSGFFKKAYLDGSKKVLTLRGGSIKEFKDVVESACIKGEILSKYHALWGLGQFTSREIFNLVKREAKGRINEEKMLKIKMEAVSKIVDREIKSRKELIKFIKKSLKKKGL